MGKKKLNHSPSIFYFSETQNSISLNGKLVLWLKLLQKTIYIYVCLLKHSLWQLHPAYPRQISSAVTKSEVRLDQQNSYLNRAHKSNKSDMTLKFFTGLNPDKMAGWK